MMYRAPRHAAFLVLISLALCVPAAAQIARHPTNVVKLKQLATDYAVRDEREHAAALVWAARHGITDLRVERPDGTVIELMYLRDGWPVFFITHNAIAGRVGSERI